MKILKITGLIGVTLLATSSVFAYCPSAKTFVSNLVVYTSGSHVCQAGYSAYTLTPPPSRGWYKAKYQICSKVTLTAADIQVTPNYSPNGLTCTYQPKPGTKYMTGKVTLI